MQPALDFRYEEHVHEGKTVGIFIIPKQVRPFWATASLGKVRPNVVYLRRGSSTVEATPIEHMRMTEMDKGRKAASIAIRAVTATGEDFPPQIEARFLAFGDLKSIPDYAPPSENVGFAFRASSITGVRARTSYWRDLAQYVTLKFASIPVHFNLASSSEFSLTDCKLEVTVKAVQPQSVTGMTGSKFPKVPERDFDPVRSVGTMPAMLAQRELDKRFEVKTVGHAVTFSARFPSLLAGESIELEEHLVVTPSTKGSLTMICRLLAAELSSPIVKEYIVEVLGESEARTFEELRNAVAPRPKD